MSLILKDKIPSPEAWKGCDLVTANSWVHHLTETAVAALDNALCGIKKAGLQFPQFCKEDFPLPDLMDDLAQYCESLETGKGFLLLRGLPVERYTDYAILHSRTKFEDFDDTSRHRKMLRLWLKMPNARRLAADFPGRNGFPESISTSASVTA